MELLYLWVEKYNNIEKQGFNFSSKYKFDYKNGELTCEENPNCVGDGFFGDNITNITAIIGKNGSGKSSVLEFIGELHTQWKIYNEEKLKNKQFLIIYKEKEEINAEYYFIEKIEIKAEFIDKITYLEVSKYKKNQEELPFFKSLNKKSDLIFYSNSINNQLRAINKVNDSNILNITTDYLLSFEDMDNRVIDYKKSEIIKQIKFFSDNYDKFKLFKIPSKIYIGLNKNIKNKRAEFHDKSQNREIFKINDLTNRIENFITENKVEDKKEKIKIDGLVLIIYSYLLKYEKYYRRGTTITDFQDVIDYKKIEIKEENNIINVLQKILVDIKKEYLTANEIENDVIEKRIKDLEKTNEFISIFFKIMEKYNTDYECIEIVLSNDYEELKLFLEKYYELFYGNYDFPIFSYLYDVNLSSGEEALVTIFSRIHYLKIEKTNFGNNIILFLDEPDIYMHPEWQRKFLSMFIEFIKTNFEGKKVQIILTSHSPFVVSDLPRENVIFLDKDDDGMCKVVESSEKKKTFGANIHTLLSDGFFMESTLGEFARSKISWVMEILDKDIEMIKTEEKKIKEIIDMIGEPIIKIKLMKMLEDKLKLNLIGVDERISRLEEEIKALKKIKGE